MLRIAAFGRPSKTHCNTTEDSPHCRVRDLGPHSRIVLCGPDRTVAVVSMERALIVNYQNVFRHIHAKGYTGVIGMEHGNSKQGKAGEQAIIDTYVVLDKF